MIIAILTTILINTAIAANPAIIFGSQGYGKNLATSGIEMASGNRIDDNATNMSIDTNLIVNSTGHFTPAVGDDSERPVTPSVYMVRGNTDQGCLEYYDGTSWNCLEAQNLGFALLGKGSIITSDGTQNGEFTACADDEILVWDSAETSGVKCEAKPSGGSNRTVSACQNGFTSGSNFVSAPSITTTGGDVELTVHACGSGAVVGAASGFIRYRRDGVNFTGGANTTNGGKAMSALDVAPAAGTYTYSIECFDCQNILLEVEEKL